MKMMETGVGLPMDEEGERLGLRLTREGGPSGFQSRYTAPPLSDSSSEGEEGSEGSEDHSLLFNLRGSYNAAMEAEGGRSMASSMASLPSEMGPDSGMNARGNGQGERERREEEGKAQVQTPAHGTRRGRGAGKPNPTAAGKSMVAGKLKAPVEPQASGTQAVKGQKKPQTQAQTQTQMQTPTRKRRRAAK